MPYLPIITAPGEGFLYEFGRRPEAPIRIYPDRWIEDDGVFTPCNGRRKLMRLGKREFRDLKRLLKRSRAEGRS